MYLNILNRDNFFSTIAKYDVIWFGEIHGIRENYLIYRELILGLAGFGYKNILWEMPSDFSESSEFSEDGRINVFSIGFLGWLKEKIDEKIIDNVSFFGDIYNLKKFGEYVGNEEAMASQVVEAIGGKKSIVITGNFHMGGPLNKELGVEPCLYHVERNGGYRILKLAIKYAGGTLYNQGVKKMSPNFYFGDVENLTFGTITTSANPDEVFVSAGEAHDVFSKKKPIVRSA